MKRRVVDGKLSAVVGNFIKRRREELQLTQLALARRLGYRYGNFITMLETHNASFPIDRWKDYAEALEVPKPEFLELVLSETFPEMMPYIAGFRSAPQEGISDEWEEIGKVVERMDDQSG